jgi:glycosyltransferase involved in cell wall biosynthesis
MDRIPTTQAYKALTWKGQDVKDIAADNPRVSIICASYNYGQYVAQAVDSLLCQDFDSLEVIVIDDASTDETRSVLARYSGNPRVGLVCHEANQGHIRTYNEGLALARGQFVGLLSADDYCCSRHAVSRVVSMFDDHPSVGMVYSGHSVVRDDQILKLVQPWPGDRVVEGFEEFRRLMWGNYILHSGTLLRRKVQDELGFYDERLTQSGDWDLWLRAAASHDVGYIAEPLFAYRMHGANMQKKGILPSAQADQNVLALERAFRALPPNAPPDILAAEDVARRHALLQTVYFDLFNGNLKRAMMGIQYAVRRNPKSCLSGELPRLMLRLAFSAFLGNARYRRSFR